MSVPSDNQRHGTSQTIRMLSFAIGLIASLVLMLFPFLLHHVSGPKLHSALPILMLGVAGAFVYGVGYSPDNRLLRALFSPICSLSLLIIGVLLLTT